MASPEERAELQAYMEQLRDLLRLDAWDLHVSDKPAEDDAILDIDPDPRRWYARIRIGSFFDDPGPTHHAEEQRQAVVHELLHLVAADLSIYTRAGYWRHSVSVDEANALECTVDDHVEKLIDFAARAIAPSLPLLRSAC